MTTATRPDIAAGLDLEAHWMPFTANRAFKSAPRLLKSARGMYFRDMDDREILDGASGLWCVNAGHGHPRIVEAIQHAASTLDFSPGFQFGHPLSFQLANDLAAILPGDIDHVFFSNSGSEAVDTALKMALAYWQARGEPKRARFVGRQRGYHGVGFGGISVGGIEPNKRAFAAQLIPQVDHLPHTHGIAENFFSRGQPRAGANLADALEELVKTRGAETIAAVIVEPMAGSTGVLVPPVGYLERLRAICDRHGILLIFDEVITGFGRLAAPFGATRFGVLPDIMCIAKGLTNGAVPMGATCVRRAVYDIVVKASQTPIEFFHGYTYSGHPLACAAGVAALDVYRTEGLFERAASMQGYWEDAVHALRGAPNVIDIRNIGLVAGIELAPREGAPGTRGADCLNECFRRGVLVRVTADIIALSPPLVIERGQIDRIIEVLRGALTAIA